MNRAFYLFEDTSRPPVLIGEWDTGHKYTRATFTPSRDTAEKWRAMLERGELPDVIAGHRPPSMPPDAEEAPVREPLPAPIPIRG